MSVQDDEYESVQHNTTLLRHRMSEQVALGLYLQFSRLYPSVERRET